MSDKIWELLAPYIASGNVEYDEGEMEELCEAVLPAVWEEVLELAQLEAKNERLEKEKHHWWVLACQRLGLLYDVMNTQPGRSMTDEEYHKWLEEFILKGIDKIDALQEKDDE